MQALYTPEDFKQRSQHALSVNWVRVHGSFAGCDWECVVQTEPKAGLILAHVHCESSRHPEVFDQETTVTEAEYTAKSYMLLIGEVLAHGLNHGHMFRDERPTFERVILFNQRGERSWDAYYGGYYWRVSQLVTGHKWLITAYIPERWHEAVGTQDTAMPELSIDWHPTVEDWQAQCRKVMALELKTLQARVASVSVKEQPMTKTTALTKEQEQAIEIERLRAELAKYTAREQQRYLRLVREWLDEYLRHADGVIGVNLVERGDRFEGEIETYHEHDDGSEERVIFKVTLSDFREGNN